jgi:palmitoyl-protein thioesterase
VPEFRNQSYRHNLASLNTLVLVIFTEDKTVMPKESAWFGSEAIPEPEQDKQKIIAPKTLIPMRLQPLYTEDWIGLRTLDKKGGVVFEACVGAHMELGGCWESLVRQYVGGKM